MNTPTQYTFDQVSKLLYEALDSLLQEPKLFEFKINERTLTQRLSLHLQPLFKGLSVDCEYNRQWCDDTDLVKRLNWKVEDTKTNDSEGKTVYPDIVVHSRGYPVPNLLVIEAKRDSPPLKGSDKDYLKLSEFTSPTGEFRYSWGAHINFKTHPTKKPMAAVVWFEKGKENGVRETLCR